MFRRHWSSLPPDPVFPADLKQLVYFVNNIDEIRSIENPNNYYKYYINKNERWNDRQRFAMNQAVESLVHTRLEKLGLIKTILPIGGPAGSPHVPIWVSPNLSKAHHVIVIFGESGQDLGILAHRVLTGPGGVTKGSMISVVEAIQKDCGLFEGHGIVIANPGQLYWWPEGKRGLTPRDRFNIPMQSAVHRGREYDAHLNAIPGHETVGRHVKSIFEEVLGKMTQSDAKLAIIATTDVADDVERYLDNEDTWNIWGDRMDSMALLDNFYGSTEPIKCEGFKAFLRMRTRAWVSDPEPLGVPLANPEGAPGRLGLGCPIFSAGPEAYLAELILIHTHPVIIKFIREAAANEDFENPRYEIVEAPPQDAQYWTANDGATEGSADDAAEESYQKSHIAIAQKVDVAANEEAGVVGDKETDAHKEASIEQEDGSQSAASKENVPASAQERYADPKKDEAVPKQNGGDKSPTFSNDTKTVGDDEPDAGPMSHHKDDGKITVSVCPDPATIRESDFFRAPGIHVPAGPDDRPIRERIADLTAKLDAEDAERKRKKAEEDARAKEMAKKQKEVEAAKEKLEFMRREVLHVVDQVEKMALRTLEQGGRKGTDDSDESEDDDDSDDMAADEKEEEPESGSDDFKDEEVL